MEKRNLQISLWNEEKKIKLPFIVKDTLGKFDSSFTIYIVKSHWSKIYKQLLLLEFSFMQFFNFRLQQIHLDFVAMNLNQREKISRIYFRTESFCIRSTGWTWLDHLQKGISSEIRWKVRLLALSCVKGGKILVNCAVTVYSLLCTKIKISFWLWSLPIWNFNSCSLEVKMHSSLMPHNIQLFFCAPFKKITYKTWWEKSVYWFG